jgi:peptide/nickel transport system substrate-binding protein
MKRLAAIALVSSAAVLLAGCSKSGADGSGDRSFVDGATFTMAISADPGALDPATAVQGSTNLLLSFAYDTLVHTDKDNKIVSGLADKWTVTPDSVTFTLHKGATCSDGSAVTPSVVARSINHWVDPATKSPLVGVLIPADVKAEADDAGGTVTLRTSSPSQFLLQTTVAIFIVCGKGLTDPSILAKETSGSGPYQLTESVANDHYTLKARPGYTWGPGGTGTGDHGVPGTVVLKIVSNESTAANLLLAGSINASSFTGADRKRVESAPGVIKSTLPDGNGEYFYNQHAGRPAEDLAVRKALTQALDLDQLATVSTQGTGKKSVGMTTLSPRPCSVDSVTGHRSAYNADAAKAGLDAAGWTVGSDGIRAKAGNKLTLKLIYATDYGPGIQAGAEFMADAWKKIGADVQLKGSASGAWADALFKTGDWDVSEVPIGVSLPSQLIAYVSGPAAPNGSNFSNIRNDQYAQLAKQAAGLPVDQGGCATWSKAESALFDNYDVVPIAELTTLLASRNAEVFIPGGLAQPTLFRMLKG